LVGIKSWPEQTVGKSWGDLQVAAGAEIAAELVETWESLKLHYIVPVPVESADTMFEIYVEPRDASKLATRILWGHAPSQSSRGEPTPQEKIARLKRIAADHGSLDGLAGPQEIDIRYEQESPASPRTARVPADDIRPQAEAKLVPTWH
jgi:hypothetical protein